MKKKQSLLFFFIISFYFILYAGNAKPYTLKNSMILKKNVPFYAILPSNYDKKAAKGKRIGFADAAYSGGFELTSDLWIGN